MLLHEELLLGQLCVTSHLPLLFTYLPQVVAFMGLLLSLYLELRSPGHIVLPTEHPVPCTIHLISQLVGLILLLTSVRLLHYQGCNCLIVYDYVSS